jgi:hypothetical protein
MHAEVRGRGRAWKVWTPDEAVRPMPVPLYDADGNFKEYLLCGAPPDKEGTKFIERNGGRSFRTQDEAIAYARYLGYEDVRVVRTATKEEALAKARAARNA